ncbi:MAG: type II secretion system protein E [Phototrophicales bacterium]|nr:MAG: type II secretion system protein E [Phototrophicales bacterium]
MSLLDRIGKGGSGGDTGERGTSKLDELRVKKAPTSAPQGPNQYKDLRTRIQNKLLNEIDPSTDPNSPNVRAQIQQLFETILAEEGLILSNKDKRSLFENILAEILGLGPLEILMKEESITEVMINGPKNVFVEVKGIVKRSNITFEDDAHVMRIIDRIVSPLGRRVDESHPYEDARLPDGSRVNIIIPPLALNGPTVTIRKFSKKPLTIEDLIRFGSMTPEIAEFLRASVIAAVNIVVSGGTGSGKTTLLNVLSNFIPSDERVITVENAAELQLQGEHVVTLESRPPNIEGKGEVTIRDLVINCLRMRPDRIVVGECRGGEALDMLQAMNTGHEGSLTTAHSNSPRDTIARLEVMCLMAGMDLPQRAIREQIASAVDMICHQSRLRDGSRKVVKVTEIQGMEGDVITMSDIFEFEQTGVEAGKVIGRIRPTGLRPKFIDRIAAAGIHLPPSVFGIGRIRH